MASDKRLHIPVKSKAMQHKIKTVMQAQGITYEQMLSRYLKIPCNDDLELLQEKHNEIRELYKEFVCNENKSTVQELYGYLWILTAKTATGDYDSIKIIKSISECISRDEWISSEYMEDD